MHVRLPPATFLGPGVWGLKDNAWRTPLCSRMKVQEAQGPCFTIRVHSKPPVRMLPMWAPPYQPHTYQQLPARRRRHRAYHLTLNVTQDPLLQSPREQALLSTPYHRNGGQHLSPTPFPATYMNSSCSPLLIPTCYDFPLRAVRLSALEWPVLIHAEDGAGSARGSSDGTARRQLRCGRQAPSTQSQLQPVITRAAPPEAVKERGWGSCIPPAPKATWKVRSMGLAATVM